MTELSTAQRTILTSAAKSPDTEIRQFMQHIKSPVIQDKMITALLRKKLITVCGNEVVGNHYKFDKDTEFVISQAGLDVINDTQPEEKSEAPTETNQAMISRSAETKQSIIINLLSCEEGATLAELIDATGWKPHSVRGHLSNLRKKRGMPIEVFTNSDGKRGYQILAEDQEVTSHEAA